MDVRTPAPRPPLFEIGHFIGRTRIVRRAPEILVAGAILPAEVAVGAICTLVPPLVAGEPVPVIDLVALTLDGQDVLADLIGDSYRPAAPGLIIATWEARNGILPEARSRGVATAVPAILLPVVIPITFDMETVTWDSETITWDDAGIIADLTFDLETITWDSVAVTWDAAAPAPASFSSTLITFDDTSTSWDAE